jgi:hypothetical protein
MTSVLVLAMFFQQTPADVKPATLEGTVMHAAAQTPIRKAKVSLTAAGSTEAAATAETGDDGKFTLKDIKPGRYRLTAEKSGYQTTAYGAKKAGDPVGQTLRIDAGSSMTALSISLPKFGVIAGKILDQEGEPVAKTLVLALNNIYVNGKRTRLPAGAVPIMSNDLGEYRIGQLPPGKYIICAIPEGGYQPNMTVSEGPAKSGESTGNTCFPNVPNPNEATALEIKDSAEVPGIDIRMLKNRTVSIKGRVNGVPTNSAAVTLLNLTPKDSGPIGRAMGPRAVLQGSDGRFEFKNVPSGSYTLQTLPTGLGSIPFVVKQNIDIGDQPINDLNVPAFIPFEVKGHIEAEASPDLKLPSLKVIAQPADDIVTTLSLTSPLDNGDFVLANIVPGKFRLAITGLPATHYVKEIRVGEQTITGDDPDLTNAATPVTVRVATSKAEISGSVRNEKGEAAPGATVSLIPEPRRPFRQRLGRADQNGTFRLQNVPPGEYLLLAFDQLENGVLEDEEFLKPLISKAKRVKVQDDAGQAFDLRITPYAER